MIEKAKEENKIEFDEYKRSAEERLNQLKYLQADFDNYRKKFDKEKEEIIRFADEKLIKELIVVLEDFERSLKEIKDEKIKEGLNLVYSNFSKILEKHGLKPIEALGKKFDYHIHEVLSKESSEKEEGIVIEEFQKGFTLKSKVIRPSKVKITSREGN